MYCYENTRRMPNNYKRTSTRHKWSKQDMDMAIEAVEGKKMGWLQASKKFNVPQATLRRHFARVPIILGRFKPTFHPEVEKDLVDHILHFESRFFGFTTSDIRKLAYQLAERMNLDHRFDKSSQMAGWDWLKGFREHNPNISLKS